MSMMRRAETPMVEQRPGTAVKQNTEQRKFFVFCPTVFVADVILFFDLTFCSPVQSLIFKDH